MFLTSPVLDPFTQRIFIGDGDGVLHFIRLSASDPCTGGVTPPCVDLTNVSLAGNTHPLIDGPIVDSSNQRVFAFINDNGSGGYSVTQATTALGNPVSALIGTNTGNPAHIGNFDNAYFNNPSTGHLYTCGTSGSIPALWRLSFNGSATMNSTPANGPLQLDTSGGTECSPVTTFFNPNDTTGGVNGTDWLFVSVGKNCLSGATGGCIMSFDITNGFPSTFSFAVAETTGTSGIVVDNVSAQPQASSVYFSTMGDASPSTGANAIKLTQSGLQ